MTDQEIEDQTIAYIGKLTKLGMPQEEILDFIRIITHMVIIELREKENEYVDA